MAATFDRLSGRETEVDRLVGAIDARRSCVIIGEAGIGKTAVLDAALAEAQVRVLRGRAFEMLMAEPYFALREAIGAQLAGEPPEVVRTLAARLRTSALAIDDVHWCDPDTIAVLNELVAAIPVIVTVRAGSHSVPGLIDRMSGMAEVIELAALDDDVVRGLLEHWHPGAPGPDLDRWTRSAAGSPLAAQVAARNAADADVDAFVHATFQRLNEEARDGAARLALNGLPLPLAEETGQALVEADLAVAVPGQGYALRHPLIAAGVVAALGADQRARIDRDLAELSSDPSRRAYHLAAAGDERAAAIARHAAAGVPTVASRAALLFLAARHDPNADEAHTLETAEALLKSARYTDVIALLTSRSFTDPEHAARADLMLADAYWTETRVDEARAAIERLRSIDSGAQNAETPNAETPNSRLVDILTLECRMGSRIDWERDHAIAVGREAVRVALEVGHGELAARNALSFAMLLAGDEGWLAELDRAQALVRADDDLHEAVVAADTLLFANLLGGDARRCRPIADRMIELTEGVSPAWNGYFRAAALLAAVIVDGNAAAARDVGPALLERPLTIRSREMASWSVAVAFADGGRDADALMLAQRAVERASDNTSRSTSLFALAETHWLAGRTAAALDAALECAALPVRGFPGQVNAALIGVWAAVELQREIDPLLVTAVASQHRNLRGAALEVEGLRATDLVKSLDSWTEAIKAWTGTSRRALARCHLGAGLAAFHVGDLAGAQAALTTAGALCAEHGLGALDGRVRAALRATGARSAAARGSLPSMNERVLRLVAAGATTSEIAATLRLQPSTVESHVRAALHASGSSTRAQAASDLQRGEESRAVLCTTVEDLERALAPYGARRTWTPADVPPEPWVLTSLEHEVVVSASVVDDPSAAQVLLAAARGLRLVVLVTDPDRGPALAEALRVTAGVRWFDPEREPVDGLGAGDHEILAALAGGASGEEVRERLGFSRRTLSRRLANIRAALAVATTTEAIARWSAVTGGP